MPSFGPARCLRRAAPCVVLTLSFHTVKPSIQLSCSFWANQVDFPKVNCCGKLELTALLARLHKIFFKFYEQLPQGVSWKNDGEGRHRCHSLFLHIKKMCFCFIFRIYIKTITFDVSPKIVPYVILLYGTVFLSQQAIYNWAPDFWNFEAEKWFEYFYSEKF